MSFLHPLLLLAGLACATIPIIVHLLLRQRRRPVPWGAMRFLIEAYKRQRKALRLQHWLLLAARCLLLALLAVALAQPLLGGAGSTGSGRTLYLLVDNGLASSLIDDAAEGAGGAERTALDRHKARAADLLRGLGPSDRAGLVLLGAPAEAIVIPPSSDLAAVLKLIEECEPSEGLTDLAGGLAAVASAVRSGEAEAGRAVTIAVLSDFLEGSADVLRPLPPALADLPGVKLVASEPRAASPGNVQVVSVEPLRSVVLTGASRGGQVEQVRLSLRRTGDGVREGGASTVRLRTGADAGAAMATQVVRWEPGQTLATVAMQAVTGPPTEEPGAGTSGSATVFVAEIDRDALPADNVFRRPVSVREALRVGVLARARFGAAGGLDRLGPAEWLRLALRPTPGAPIDVASIDPAVLDAPTLAAQDVILVAAPEQVREDDWPRLRRFVDAGGLLIVFPAAEDTVHLWTDSMVRELGLAWRLGREARVHDGGVALDDRPEPSSLLALIQAEFAALSRPVRILKSLAPEEPARGAGQVVLRLSDGTPWMVSAQAGSAADANDERGEGAEGTGSEQGGVGVASRGLVVYVASAPTLSWTDLPAKPLMVPLLQEICRQGFGGALGSQTEPAGRFASAPSRAARLVARESGAGGEIAVGADGLTARAIRRAGLYDAFDESARNVGLLAVNADADAGRTGAQEPDAVRGWLAAAQGPAGATGATVGWITDEGAADVLGGRVDRTSAWSFPLLLAALLMGVAELFMARWFSHAVLERGEGSGAGAAAPGAGAVA